MDASEFEDRFSTQVSKVAYYNLGYNKDMKLPTRANHYSTVSNNVYADSSINKQMDEVLTELAELYLAGDENQKQQIYDYFATKEILHDLWIYIRRAARQINSQDNIKSVQYGIAAAFLDGARQYSAKQLKSVENLVNSLVLLRFAAEYNEIDIKSLFDKAIQNADDKLQPVLVIARDMQESEMRQIVKTYRADFWISNNL